MEALKSGLNAFPCFQPDDLLHPILATAQFVSTQYTEAFGPQFLTSM
jgi:hypothetical protein